MKHELTIRVFDRLLSKKPGYKLRTIRGPTRSRWSLSLRPPFTRKVVIVAIQRETERPTRGDRTVYEVQ